ncbi:MAG: undecaprenyl-diphosphatase UppP [bacterium]|nr:undecaprenyl-diphosphatase UppP [bacterium]
MSLFQAISQAIILGLVQGLTEFLPVSSSAHLVLVPYFMHWGEPDIIFDVGVHLGTLVAVLGFFWREVIKLLTAFIKSLINRNINFNSDSRLAWIILVATIPAGLFGYLFESQFESLFGKPYIVGWFLLVTAILLMTSEYVNKRFIMPVQEVTFIRGLLIGFAQAIAIAPGISRSGSTIAVGLFTGLNRETAARFSFLLSIPIILGAGLVQLKELIHLQVTNAYLTILLVGFISAAVSGYFAIKYFLRYVQKNSLNIFAYYCIFIWLIVLLFGR